MAKAGNALEIGGAIWIGIAGLDIALWDIKGKALNLPIHALLGGKIKDQVPVYASSMKRDMTPLEEAKRAVSLVEQGYSAYKLHSAVPGKIDDPSDPDGIVNEMPCSHVFHMDCLTPWLE